MTSTTLPPLETLRTQSPAFAARKVAHASLMSLGPDHVGLWRLCAVREVAVRASEGLEARP